MPLAGRNRALVRMTVDLPVGSFQKIVRLEDSINDARGKGAGKKLNHNALLRGLLGSWVLRMNGGG